MIPSAGFTGFDCVVPAAGASSRMAALAQGAWKLMLPWNGSTIIETVVATALQVCPRVLLVTGFRGAELADLFRDEPRVCCVPHPGWELGMASSIAAGVAQVGTPRFFLALADMPGLTPELFSLVASSPASDVVRPFFQGQPGHPVLFDRSVIPRIVAWKGASLRDLVATLSVRRVEMNDPGCVQDIDVPGDLGKFSRHAYR